MGDDLRAIFTAFSAEAGQRALGSSPRQRQNVLELAPTPS